MPDRHERTIDDLTDVGDTRPAEDPDDGVEHTHTSDGLKSLTHTHRRGDVPHGHHGWRYSEAAAPSDPDHAGAHQAILDIADRLGAGAARMLVDAADLLTNEPADGMPPVLAERCAACNHRRFAHRPPGGWYRPGPCQHVADQQPHLTEPGGQIRVDMCDCPGFVAGDPGPRFDSVAARLDRIEDRLARLLPGMDDHVDHHPGLHSTRARFDRVDEGTARVLADVDQLRDQLARIGDSLAAHYQHAGHDQAAAVLRALRRPEVDRTLSAMDRVTQWDAEQVIYQVLTTTSGLSEPAIGEHRATRLAERIAHALYGESTELAPVDPMPGPGRPPWLTNGAPVTHPQHGPGIIAANAWTPDEGYTARVTWANGQGPATFVPVGDLRPIGYADTGMAWSPERGHFPDPHVGGHVDLVEPEGLPAGTRVTHPHHGAGTVNGVGHPETGPTCLVVWDVPPGPGPHWIPAADLTVDAEQTCSHLPEGTDKRCGRNAHVVTRLGWRCPDHAPEQPAAGWVDDGRVAALPDRSMTVALPPADPAGPPEAGSGIRAVGRLCAWPADGHIPSSIHVDTGARCRLPAHHRAVSPDDQTVTYSLPVCGDHLALARELDDWWIERLGTLEPAAAVINADGQDVQVFDDLTCTCGPRGSDGPDPDCPQHGGDPGDQIPEAGRFHGHAHDDYGRDT